MEHIWALWGGFVLDFLIGDPQDWWHPVRSIGWLIGALEKQLRRIFPRTKQGELAAGAALVFFTAGISTGVAALILWAAGRIHPLLRFLVMCVMCGQLLAARSLETESGKVRLFLDQGDTEGARQAVSMIVGRDTKRLTEEGIAKAAVETVAENASDGVIAPLLWMLVLGPLGGFFYKAVNTMDSMVGYKNDRYHAFGTAAAMLDDVVNFIPARISAMLMILSCCFLGNEFDQKNAMKIFKRDRYQHASPNSAQTEAACAGALGIRLAGDASYFGRIVKKPYIGDPLRAVETEDIRRANRLLYGMAFFGWGICMAVWVCVTAIV